MDLNILFVDDEQKMRENLVKIFNQDEILGHTLFAKGSTFEEGMANITRCDIIVLDLYKGEPKEGGDSSGFKILNEIQSLTFVPVIFYSGLTKDLANLRSEIVGVVNKGDGVEKLRSEKLNVLFLLT
jgi:DNA-binding NtrC family response regulator